MGNNSANSKMRIYHQVFRIFFSRNYGCLCYSGFTMIFRDTGFLKFNKQIERQLHPN